MNIPVYICDAIRTPFGRYGGLLSAIRADDLAALPLLTLMERHPGIDWEQVSDVVLGCAGQTGEEGHNIARQASLLAGLPASVPAVTLNRLCGSGLDAVGSAARFIRCGEAALMIAGGVEAMSRFPYMIGKAESVLVRSARVEEGNNGQLLNPLLKKEIVSMAQAAENVAREFGIERAAQDRFALASRHKAAAAAGKGNLTEEITPVAMAQKKNGDPVVIAADEQVPSASMDELTALEPLLSADGTVTAGNRAGSGDGACALLLACEKSAHRCSLLPKARIISMATAGVPPQLAGMGAAPAARKALVHAGLNMEQMDLIELHETFAAAAIGVLRDWGLQDDDPRVNPNGGALAFGDPLGASGARLACSALYQLHRSRGRYALCAMSTEAGQGVALIIERV